MGYNNALWDIATHYGI